MESARSTNYVARHWRGDLSLGQSFWLNGVLIGLPFKVVGKIANEIAWDPPQANFLTWSLIAGLGLLSLLVFYVWSEVGIWRASFKYPGWSIWSFGARLVTLLGLITGLGQYQIDKEKAVARDPYAAILDSAFDQARPKAKGEPLQASGVDLSAAPQSRAPAAPTHTYDAIARARAIRAAGLGWESLAPQSPPHLAPQSPH